MGLTREQENFIEEHFDVIKMMVVECGKKQIKTLGERKPCKVRADCDVPYKCKCLIKVDGEEIKTIQQCEDCDVMAVLLK